MSISSTVEPREHVARDVLATLAAAVKRLCVAYITWRMHQSEVAVLRAMSDRELSNIGLTRSDATGAVNEEGGRRSPALCRGPFIAITP